MPAAASPPQYVHTRAGRCRRELPAALAGATSYLPYCTPLASPALANKLRTALTSLFDSAAGGSVRPSVLYQSAAATTLFSAGVFWSLSRAGGAGCWSRVWFVTQRLAPPLARAGEPGLVHNSWAGALLRTGRLPCRLIHSFSFEPNERAPPFQWLAAAVHSPPAGQVRAAAAAPQLCFPAAC